MALTHMAVSGYRSLRQLVLPMGKLTLVTGLNGSGKSNLYRSLRLLSAVAQGRLITALAQEGGLPAVMWAGQDVGNHHKAARLRLGFATDELSYAIELGYPQDPHSAFALDPEIKHEWIWAGSAFHPRALLTERAGALQAGVDPSGVASGGLFNCGIDPREAPEVYVLRDLIQSWRFYDGFRSDAGAPARNPGIATRCIALGGDGHDLPAAIRTIQEIGDWEGLQMAIDAAFPGCEIFVDKSTAIFRLQMKQPGLLRALDASELSDGTMRYLLLMAALYSPRLPPLLVLNEPENSLHPGLITPLAQQIGKISQLTQIWVIAHNLELIEALSAVEGCRHHRLERDAGATDLPGQSILEKAAWRWP
ncbi:AAA family ATPase [Cyanobium sp. HWJ4-Hawea]|uniref:AAA family ATPase n=1 Tax=Cyanobium sp. HWJ4-Hawea TaxID=2823713 RepID=UPI0020CCC95E|nr:AAA family ATPase [Cyanobium sp. HWJ4-Hawea]MCP9810151.1 AAA family ATPase [Cyanobium sp. HWJ4-Hawea]